MKTSHETKAKYDKSKEEENGQQMMDGNNMIKKRTENGPFAGHKSAMLESKLRTGTSKTKKMQICLDEVALFWMSQWTTCSPAWRILYHVTASCKGPIKL